MDFVRGCGRARGASRSSAGATRGAPASLSNGASMDRPRGATRRRPRLSRSADFQRVYRQGDSVASRHFVLYAFPREESVENAAEEVRLGVSVGRRVGGSVERNRVKRLLREAFWALPAAPPDSHDYVVGARQGAAELADSGGLEAFKSELQALLERLESEPEAAR